MCSYSEGEDVIYKHYAVGISGNEFRVEGFVSRNSNIALSSWYDVMMMLWWCNHSEWGIPHHWECCESGRGEDGAHEAGADLPLLQWVRMYVSFPCLHGIQELDRWIILSVVCLPSLLPQFSIPEFCKTEPGMESLVWGYCTHTPLPPILPQTVNRVSTQYRSAPRNHLTTSRHKSTPWVANLEK